MFHLIYIFGMIIICCFMQFCLFLIFDVISSKELDTSAK